MEYCLSPAVNALQDRLKENEIRLALLMEEAKFLEAEAVSRESEMNSGSPRRLPSHGVRGNLPRGQREREVQASSDSAGARSPGGIGSRRRES
ncbi:putative lys-63-specific deubiquitinase BRCC36 [Cocos nucifera]|nr:putative lys-63-specific deubiquitinase BRCC36 [Cocos nucifera]